MSESLPLRVQGLTHRYPGERLDVFTALQLEVAPGELFAVLGSSGCGKSSLLRAIAGFITPRAGRIEIRGEAVTVDGELRVPPEARRVGMVFQDHALFPHMTVAGNIRFGIHTHPDHNDRVRELLSLAGIYGAGH